MATLPTFQFTTQEDWYWEIPLLNADANNAPLSLMDSDGKARRFAVDLAPAGAGQSVVRALVMGDGIEIKTGEDNTLVFRVSREASAGFLPGEYTADVLELVDGERHLFIPVRVRFGEPSGVLDFQRHAAGVAYAQNRLPISTPVAVAGRQGARGTSLLNGQRMPTTDDGGEGDFWIDTEAEPRRLYGPKGADRLWPAAYVEILTNITPGMIAARDRAEAAADEAEATVAAVARDRAAAEAARVGADQEADRAEAAAAAAASRVAEAVSRDSIAAEQARARAETAAGVAAEVRTRVGEDRAAVETALTDARGIFGDAQQLQATVGVVTAARDTTVAARDVATTAQGAVSGLRDETRTLRDQARVAAASAEAASGLPAFAPTDAGRVLAVKADASGLEWSNKLKILALAGL